MRYKFAPFLFGFSVVFGATSCADFFETGVMENYQICSGANDQMPIVGKGFLQFAEQTECSKNSDAPPRHCAFKFTEKAADPDGEVVINLPEGTGNNQIETPETEISAAPPPPTSVFSRAQLKIRLDDGTLLAPQTGVSVPLVATGKVNVKANGKIRCTVEITKLEKD